MHRCRETSQDDGECETVFYGSMRNNRVPGHARHEIQGHPTTKKVYRSERNERKRERERELGLPRLDSFACTSSTHHRLVDVHSVYCFSLSRVISCGSVRRCSVRPLLFHKSL